MSRADRLDGLRYLIELSAMEARALDLDFEAYLLGMAALSLDGSDAMQDLQSGARAEPDEPPQGSTPLGH